MAGKKRMVPLVSQESKDFDADENESSLLGESSSGECARRQDEIKEPKKVCMNMEDNDERIIPVERHKKGFWKNLGTHWRFVVAYLSPFILALIPIFIPGQVHISQK